MKRKKIAIVFAAMSLMLMTGCGAQKEKLKADTPVEKEFSEVSVHDPSIIEGEDGSYYIFGSHLAVAKTEDLMNWTYVNQGVKNNNTVIPNVLKEMKEAFEWSQSNTFWAPDVIKLNDGSYKLYYCNCKGDSPLSCLGTAVSDSVEGPYSNEGIMLKSGMSASEKDEDGNLYQATTDPNVIDPVVFYDKEGKLWMIYGSYSGGIFVKEMDAESGMPLESGYGEKLLGGNHLRIEAPYVIYNEETGYYYMFLSFGGLDSDGGYNIRVCRSENPNGPYVDSMGQDMKDCKGPAGSAFSDATAEQYGTKLMGGYKFTWKEGEEGEDRKGYLSPGHNSCLYQEETVSLLQDVYHPHRECIPKVQEETLESLLIRNSSKCRLTDKLQMRVPKNKILQICHSDGKIKIDEERIVENGIEVTGVVELRALYVVSDDEMPFYAAETALPFRHTIEVPGIGPDCRYELQSSIDQLSTTMPDSSDIEAKVVLNLNALVFRRRKEMVMQYVEEKDRDPEELQSLPGITCYFVKPGDTLWDIAKKFYTTTDKIRELNELKTETLTPMQQLLVERV